VRQIASGMTVVGSAVAASAALLALPSASSLGGGTDTQQQTAEASTPAGRPAFEVSSVRRNVSGGGSTITSRPGGVFVARGASLQFLILWAYGVRDDQLLGGPDWIRTDRFDIEAQAGAEVSGEVRSIMVRTLMEDRFGLALNREQRERDVYVLTRARSDGRLGPNLLPMDSDCEARRKAGEPVTPLQPRPAFERGATPAGTSRSMGTCAPVSVIATMLQRMLTTTVLDKTGLDGRWDYVLSYASGGLPGSRSTGAGTELPPGDAPPSLFIALQEQFGLKLERQRGMVEVLAITSVHPPTEN